MDETKYRDSFRRRTPGRVLILLVSVTLFAPSIAWGAKESPGVPFTLTLIAEADRTGVLKYVAKRYDIGAQKGRADRVEATAISTGFELSFLGTIPSAGRVGVKLNLALTLPKKPSGRKPARVQKFSVAATFEAADGESVLIPETMDGPEIVVTPRIVTGGVGPPELLLQVEVPIGGQEVSLPAQRFDKSIQLVGVEGSKSWIREAAGHSFVTGVSEGTANLTQLQAGAELAAVISTDGDTGVGLEITVGCDLVDEPVATETVRIGSLSQDVQLPVARSLTLQTVVSIHSGDTWVLATVFTGDADPTEIIIFATPHLVVETPVPQALVEARALAASGGTVEPPEGAIERTKNQKELIIEASEPHSGILVQQEKQHFVVGDQDGETITLSMESETALKFSPRTLAPGELLLGVDLSAMSFAPESPQFPLNTASGVMSVECPETQILDLNTNISLYDGQSIALGGGILQWEVPENSEKTELIFLATAGVLDGGVVRLKGQLARAIQQQSNEPGIVPDDVVFECSGSFNRQSKMGPDGVERNVSEALQCLKSEPPP